MQENYSERFATRDAVEEYELLYAEPHGYAALLYGIEKTILSKVVSDKAEDVTERSMLDFATGTGRILAHLENEFAYSEGVDISQEMISACKKRVAKSRLRCADLTSEPLEREFDVITAFRFFLNANPILGEKVCDSLVPLMKPGGLLVVNNHGRAFSANILGSLKRALGGRSKQRTMRDGDFERLFESRGLRIVGKVGYGLLGAKIAHLIGYKTALRFETSFCGGILAGWFGTCAIYVFTNQKDG